MITAERATQSDGRTRSAVISAAGRELDAGTTAMLVSVGPILIGTACTSGAGRATLGSAALCLLAAVCAMIGVMARWSASL